MTLITYQRQIVAVAGADRFSLAPAIDELPDGDALKTFVCFLVLYARDVRTGALPGDPCRYLPCRGERYARAALMPAREFLTAAHRSDRELAEHFQVPLEQIARRRQVEAIGAGDGNDLALVGDERHGHGRRVGGDFAPRRATA